MNRLYSRAGAFALSSALSLITVGRLSAQITAAPNAAEVAKTTAVSTTAGEEAIVLSPFVVEASEDADSYAAKNTLAGTRVRTELKDVGSAIQAITAKFLQDTGATSSQDLLRYTTGTEVGGSSGNFVGAGNGQSIDTRSARIEPQTNTRVRGLAAADNTRDFFLTDIPWDSYNVGRVDIQRGPNSILFGIGSPAGIVNSSLNTASFKDENKVEMRLDNFGTQRFSADFNKVILKNELAIRITLLDNDIKYEQKPAYNHDKRFFGAFTYRPAFLKRNGMETNIHASYESGHVQANRPRVIPPVDAITTWFDPSQATTYKKTFNDTVINDTSNAARAISPTAGALSQYLADNTTPNPTYSPWLGAYGGQIFDQPTAIFANPNNGNLSGYFMPSRNTQGVAGKPADFNGGGWSVYKGLSNYSDWAQLTHQPNYLLGVYKVKTIADTGIFDYNKQLIDGPNKQEMQKFHALNAVLSQTFMDNVFGLELAFDHQAYADEDDALIGTPYLTVEVANTLPDGRANPNVGRAMTIGSPYSAGGKNTERNDIRFTGYGEADFKKILGSNSGLASILGVHRFTVLDTSHQYDEFDAGWYTYVTNESTFRPWQDVSLDSRRIPSVSYLSGDLTGVASANLAHIQNIKGIQTPYTDQVFDFNPEYKPAVLNTAVYDIRDGSGNLTTTPDFGHPTGLSDLIGWQWRPFEVLDGYHGQNRNALTTSSSVHKLRDKINSEAAVWQGFLWDGNLVTTVGWRKDTDRNYNAGNATANADNSWDYSDKTWNLPSGPNDPRVGHNNVTYQSATGESKSWSFVLHTPKELRKKMPLGTDISLFFNHSDNFQPAGGRRDIYGDQIASPTGKTKDYGITITTFNDKLTLKINRYDTSIKNASLDGGGTGALQNVYRVSSNEAWGYMFAKWAQLNIPDFQGGANYARTTPSDPTSPLIDPTVPLLQYQPLPGQTVAAALAAQNLAINTFLDPANKPSEKFLNYWGINRDTWDPTKGWAAGGVNFIVPSGLAVTGDTESKGTEYELTAQPTPGWNITINAAHTSAQRLNLANSFSSYVDARNTFYDGPGGQVRMWNGSVSGSQTLKQVWDTDFYSSYLLYKLQEHADVPELRPWRFNLITNYDFRSGSLKGFNVGGGYRWQDGIVVGYPIANGFFDLAHPWMGPKETAVDLWVGYQRKLTNKIVWRIQLNGSNVLGNNKLIPVTVQYDGSPGTSRIAEPKVFTLTNSFTF